MMKPGEQELVLIGGPKAVKRASPSRRAFDAAKQEIFFQTLRSTCNVSRATKASGVSFQTVYSHRKRSAAFRARWAEVLRDAYADLELAMLERMLNGTVKKVTRGRRVHETVREYPNAVALQLLRMHRDSVAEANVEHDRAEVEELRAKIARKLGRLRERIEREKEGNAGPRPE